MIIVIQIVLILTVLLEIKSDNTIELRIGGLFTDNESETAFRLAANLLNRRYQYSNYRLIPNALTINHYNTFNVNQQACNLLRKGVIGVFGPSSLYSSAYMTGVLDRKEMPHIETHCDIKLQRNNCLLNLYPHPSVLSRAIVDVIIAYNWKKFTIIYENEESLNRIGPLLDSFVNSHHLVTLKQLELDDDDSYRQTLTTIKHSDDVNFVVDCSIENLEELLKQIQQVGLMTERYNYLITNLDLQIIDLKQYQYGGTNITGIRIIDPEDPKVVHMTKKLHKTKLENGVKTKINIPPLSSALIIDAVDLFYETLTDLTNNGDFLITPKPLYCNSSDSWKYGHTIINLMKRKSIKGLTGMVMFDVEGFRRDFTLGIVALTNKGLNKIGSWSPAKRLNITRRVVAENVQLDEGSLVNRTFRIITCLTAPYAMLKEETAQLIGNDRFEGFGIDLISELANMLGFKYIIEIQENNTNGSQDPATKEWNGMIGDIIKKKADLAIGDLTVTSDREKYVDFTLQFMTLGIKILYRKPEPAPPSLFLFVSPFAIGVWILVGVAFLFVSLAFFIMGRLSPSEWTNPYPCIEEPDYYINQFNLRNCLWFTAAGLTQQGTDIAPIGISTRTGAGVWWFFVLIMVSSYTANLAAFLTVETLVTSFNSLEELAEQTEIKYGAKRDGATANYFKNAEDGSVRQKIWKYMAKHDEVMTKDNDEGVRRVETGATANYFKNAEDGSVRQKIWKYMAKHDEVMTKDNDEGVRRVETEKYAFFMESTSIDYVTERHCSLASVGKSLDEKGYAIAMEKGSPYRNVLSTAILKLQETGKISEIQEKWWKEKCGAGRCESKEQSEATPLSLKNAGGVFLVLTVGSILGFFASFFEMALNIYLRSRKFKVTFKEELKKELKFFLEFKRNVKPIEQVAP